MPEIVLLSVVNNIRALLQRPSVPSGRALIDRELNKKRDPVMTSDINNAMRWLVQEGELERQTNEAEPRWWLVSRGIPTDRDDQVIPLVKGLERPFDGELVDDTKPKRAVKEVVPTQEPESEPMVDVQPQQAAVINVKPKKAPKKAPEPEVAARTNVFTLSPDSNPVWNIDSNGDLGCIVEGQYVMVLFHKQAKSLSQFVQATNGVYANKDSNVL